MSGRLSESELVLRDACCRLAVEWLAVYERSKYRTLPECATEWDIYIETQARLICALQNVPYSKDDNRHAKRYLAFLAAQVMLDARCPMDELNAARVWLALSVTVEQAQRFEAYLAHVDRGKFAKPVSAQEEDYFRAVNRFDAKLNTCPYPDRTDCMSRLNDYHHVACSHVFGGNGEVRTNRIRNAKLSLLRYENAHDEVVVEEVEEFVEEFYRWFDNERDTLPVALAERLHNQSKITNLVERVAKCFLFRELPAEQRASVFHRCRKPWPPMQ